MKDRNQYTKQTIEMYESLLKFKDEISITKDNRKKFKGRAKSYKDNWDKHVRAKGIVGSDIDKKFQSALKQSEVKLLETNLNKLKLKDTRNLIYALDEIDNSEVRLKNVIEDTLNDITKKLDEIRINIEKKVSISELIEIEKRNSNERLLKDMSLECMNRANRLQEYFNRVVDAVEILEELNEKGIDDFVKKR